MSKYVQEDDSKDVDGNVVFVYFNEPCLAIDK